MQIKSRAEALLKMMVAAVVYTVVHIKTGKTGCKPCPFSFYDPDDSRCFSLFLPDAAIDLNRCQPQNFRFFASRPDPVNMPMGFPDVRARGLSGTMRPVRI